MIKPDYISRSGRIRFYNCDCMELMQSGKTWDLAIVDPPYGINAANMNMGTNLNRNGKDQYPGESTASRIKKGRLNQGSGKLKNRNLNTMNCDWDSEPPTDEYFKKLRSVSKNQIIWGGNYFSLGPCRGFIIWNKNQPWENFSQAEFAWTSFDIPAKVFTFSNRGGANEEKKIHPTQKGVEIYNYCLKLAKDGDTILDTHGGSMSLAIACDVLGFELDICELDHEYFKAALNRFKLHERQLSLFDDFYLKASV